MEPQRNRQPVEFSTALQRGLPGAETASRRENSRQSRGLHRRGDGFADWHVDWLITGVRTVKQMSQRSVERVIGRLVTDEAFRRRFGRDPGTALREMTECGAELTGSELRALSCLDAGLAADFAAVIDPRLQKTDLHASAGE
jgi:hypothetical protein